MPSVLINMQVSDGFPSCDWHWFQYSLIKVYDTPILHHEIKRQKLCNFVEDSSRIQMGHEDHVLRYHKDFQYYSTPLVHSCHMTEEDHDAAFWYGFHPVDREALQLRLRARYPFKPYSLPFPFEDVFHCTHEIFKYKESCSFRSHELQFEPQSVYCGFPSPSLLMPDPRLPSSFSSLCLPPTLELQFKLMPSETVEQPKPENSSPPRTNFIPKLEPEYTRSITPSLPHMTSLMPLCAEVVPKSKSVSSSSFVQMSSLWQSTPLLLSSCSDVDPELASAPSSLSVHVSTDFEHPCPPV